MSWQIPFANVFGPGLFSGTSFNDFWRMLRLNRFRVHPLRSTRLASAFQNSVATSLVKRAEMRKFADRWRATTVHDPIIILGHWRSGTTYLHNLLAQDERFAYPNLYQVMYPHVFLKTEQTNTRLLSIFLPRTRFGLDNVHLKWTVPYEDEFALAASCRSAYWAWAWPKSQPYYDRYLTMQDVSQEDVTAWRNSMLTFVQKLSFKHQKPLILKSPPHTCRIKLLLELFPRARFIHVHRNPYEVFSSRRRLDEVALRGWTMQSTKSVNWDDRILRIYSHMYDVFLKEVALIPSGHFHEVRFDELEQQPLDTLQRIYEALQLPSFLGVEETLRTYVRSLSNYRKNRFPELAPESKKRISQQWGRFFEQWGYRM